MGGGIIPARFCAMNYGLPVAAEIGGRPFSIRTDFRVMLDIIECMNDPELSGADKAEAALVMFYPDADALPDVEEAVSFLLWFMDGGKDPERENRKSPRLVDWERDFDHIIAPVNRVLGLEARGVPYDIESNTGGLHWWTFLAAYMEIGGDCLMAQIVNIRDKKARGKKLEKNEREWYRRNQKLVDLPTRYTEAEKDLEKEWT